MEKPTITKENIDIKVIYIRFRGSYLEFRRNALKMYKELVVFAEKNKWKRSGCGDLICCHNGLCLNCNIDKLKNKKTK